MKKQSTAIGNEEREYTAAKNKIDEALKVKSRTYLGLCKNETCYNLRRKHSAYCEICANN